LTPTEYDVLRLLVVHAGKILTHGMIASEIWGPDTTNGAHYVRVFVNTIRKKLREDRRNPYIRSHLGIGYEFVALDTALDSVAARRK
jgi:two-component system, OmpR family, KDP operon response regulator KdpE